MRRGSAHRLGLPLTGCLALAVCLILLASTTMLETIFVRPLLVDAAVEPAPPGTRIDTRGLLLLTNDRADLLNSEEFWASRRAVSGGGLAKPPSQARPSGATRNPFPSTSTRSPSPANAERLAPSGKSKLPVKKVSTSKDDDEDDDSENPWTKEDSRGTYRTLCVRLCDGYYFPISFATTKEHFSRDAKLCERSCKSPARLFYHENPGQDPEDMEDSKGKRYKDLKIAFQHRKQYDEACTCKPQPWDEAALARHRQFAELAERKKGGKRAEPQSKIVRAKEAQEFATPAAVSPAAAAAGDWVEVQAAELRAFSERRRQSALPALVPMLLASDGLRAPFARPMRLHQTSLKDVRKPRQNRLAPALAITARPLAHSAQTERPSLSAPVSVPAAPSGRTAQGRSPKSETSLQHRNPSPEKRAAGSDTHLR